MNRRFVAAVVAVLLAVVGAVLVFSYVSGADERAMAGMEPVSVLLVAEPVAEGTPAEELAELVTATELPAAAVVAGAVASLDDVSGQVVTADLQPGEQLLASRFVDPATFADSALVPVPAGLQEVSVLLDSQRVLGGVVVPGDTVGVFLSITRGEESLTSLVQHKVLVTRIEGGIPATPVATSEEPEAPVASTVPAGSVLVTLAVDTPNAEQVVFGAEHGTLWLSLENGEASESGGRVVTKENVYE